MVAFIDLAPVPTAMLFLAVPVALDEGGWTWGELARFPGVLAREYVYSAHEVAAVVSTYGTMLAHMIKTSEADRFCISVRGRITGALVWRAEWAWDDHAHVYAPYGEPIDGWREAARAYWNITGELISNQKFSASSGRLTVVSDVLLRPFSTAA
jgi:hypothetical protein